MVHGERRDFKARYRQSLSGLELVHDHPHVIPNVREEIQEPGDELTGPDGAVERGIGGSQQPARRPDREQIAHVIEMEMGEQERIELRPLDRELSKTAEDPAAAVDQHKLPIFIQEIP